MRARVANEAGGILVTDEDGMQFYLEPGTTDHDRALSGYFGPVQPYDPEYVLNEERGKMRVFRRAMFDVLMGLPVEASPELAAKFPDAAHLREGIDLYVATLPTYDPLRTIVTDVTEFIRIHPDVDAVKVALGIDDAALDDIFRAAMDIEG